MWLVIAAFVCPAAIFSLCGFLAWVRMWHMSRRREHKVFEQIEEQVRQRIEKHRQSMYEEGCDNYSRQSSIPMIKLEESGTRFDRKPSVLFV